MKIIERVKNLERLCLPETAGSSDTTWLFKKKTFYYYFD